MAMVSPGFAGKVSSARGLRLAACVVCALTFFSGFGPRLRASETLSGQNATRAQTSPNQSTSGKKSAVQSAADAAYAKYLSERRDVRRFQRRQERKEEIQQRKVEDPEANDGANVYRHSAMVQTLAGLFGLSVETTARLFEVLNFLILMAAVIWFIARHMPKTLRNRKERIQNEIQQARVATEDANRRLADVEQRLGRLDADIRELQLQAQQETAAEEKRLRSALQEEKQRIIDAAANEVTAASLNAQRELKNLAAELVIERAKRRITVSAEVDRVLVADFLADLDSKHPAGGRVN